MLGEEKRGAYLQLSASYFIEQPSHEDSRTLVTFVKIRDLNGFSFL